jgi:hypothetical protein
MPAMQSPPRLRKRRLEANAATSAADEIDIAGCAAIAYTSEDPAHPVEHMLDGCCGPGAPRWMSARPDTTEHIVIEIDRPQTISGLVYEVEETTRERTQEVRVRNQSELARGALMSELRADDDVGISSVRRMGVGDLVTARAPDRVNRSQSEPDEVRQTLICAAITEVRSDRQTNRGGD